MAWIKKKNVLSSSTWKGIVVWGLFYNRMLTDSASCLTVIVRVVRVYSQTHQSEWNDKVFRKAVSLGGTGCDSFLVGEMHPPFDINKSGMSNSVMVVRDGVILHYDNARPYAARQSQ